MPARQTPSPTNLGKPLNDGPTLSLGHDDQQLITLFQHCSGVRGEGSITADNEGNDAITWKSQLAECHPSQM